MRERSKKLPKSTEDTTFIQTAELNVANRLRKMRRDKGLTLDQLAKKASLSQAFLSRVENHKLAIPIGSLERVAQVLNVPLSVFFEGDEVTSPIVVCRAGKGVRRHFRGRKSFSFELLAASKHGKLMEPFLVDISTITHKRELITHPGEEFNYVLKGETYLIYGKQKIHLKEGDCVYYDAMVPHAGQSVPGKPGVIFSMVASKDYLFHGDLMNLLKGAH
ncbi:MAG: cupin domain-containing protein [Chthoniobacterales bacterium]